MSQATATTWDTKSLLNKLQEAGMPVLEDGAMKVLNAVFDWVEDSVSKSENKYDDLILTVLPLMRKYTLNLADKIANLDDMSEGSSEFGKDGPEQVASNPVEQLPMA